MINNANESQIDGPSFSGSVIEEVAKEKGVDAVEIPPLYDTIDPNALDSLFQNTDSGSVHFIYCGYDVSVFSDGRVIADEGEAEE